MREYLSPIDDVAQAYDTNIKDGLDAQQASERLAHDGENRLAEQEPTPLWRCFLSQLADPMIVLLIVAAILSALTNVAQGENDFADVIIIVIVVIANAIIGVVQETKAENAIKALQDMSASHSKVIRNGKQHDVPSSELVKGDVIVLEAGDAIPADCRIIEAHSLKIEESALTGESVPSDKNADIITVDGESDVPLGDRSNMGYMGTTVVYGRGRAIVTATGMGTEMGRIAEAITTSEREETPLQKRLDGLSKTLSIACVIICAVVFCITWLKHGMGFFGDVNLVLDTLMIAISLAVAAVPEGLSAVVTIILSIGVTKMSRQNAIIRKLAAVETLGCTQVICTDKTGTLTQNRMTVVEHASADDGELVKCMALCSDAEWDADEQKSIGEPTEVALVTDAAKNGMPSIKSQYRRVGEAPFDSMRKMMTVIYEGTDGYTQYTKGAPDVIISRCSKIRTADGDVLLTQELRDKVLSENKSMSDRALRVLAGAERQYEEMPSDMSADALEHDMTFIGMSAMMDPVRPEVRDAVDEAHKAGIRVVMITGDHIDTAIAIGRELGIIENASQAMTGTQLDSLSDDEFEQVIGRIGVYARVQPENKTRIVETWKRLGKVVAMTGDGVNDAPSIKRADIGIGMGITGTDVTKDVASMVLADDNFATIIDACAEGRRIYDNIRKSIAFLLSSNLAEVISIFVASLIGFTILEPIHLLWVNLLTDTFPAIAMATEDAEPGIMERKPRDSKDGIFSDSMGLDCIVQGIMIGGLTLIAYLVGIRMGGVTLADIISGTNQGLDGMTMAFLTLSMVEMFHSLNMRSRRESIFRLPTQNRWLWLALIGCFLLTLVVIETPLSGVFHFAEIGLGEYAVSILLAVSIIPLVEAYKAAMRKLGR